MTSYYTSIDVDLAWHKLLKPFSPLSDGTVVNIFSEAQDVDIRDFENLPAISLELRYETPDTDRLEGWIESPVGYVYDGAGIEKQEVWMKQPQPYLLTYFMTVRALKPEHSREIDYKFATLIKNDHVLEIPVDDTVHYVNYRHTFFENLEWEGSRYAGEVDNGDRLFGSVRLYLAHVLYYYPQNVLYDLPKQTKWDLSVRYKNSSGVYTNKEALEAITTHRS